ncbi:hypothetical protein [Metasolibacillus meyeri]|uniref:hypothetical protein n=1 Tax=Metasolibacillus meyeri TaxID=1071052 RepID=UPI000D30D796|nr:hypothetical protein [Metasolibacillus meyeri]
MEEKSIFERNDDFSSLVKTAKRKSLKKTILISIIVTVMVFALLWAVLAVGIYFMNKRIETQLDGLYTELYFTGANIESNATSFDNFLVATKTSSKLYKRVGPHLIDWGTFDYFYTILGAQTVLQTGGAMSINDSSLYTNNQRALTFHVPSEPTNKNDFDYIVGLPDFYNIEVAISFKELLPLSTVQTQFPTTQWAWLLDDGIYAEIEEVKKAEEEASPELSTLFPKDTSEVSDSRAYGFSVWNHTPIESAEFYKEQLAYREGPQVDIMRHIIGEQAPKDWLVAGVVLTGKQEELLPYLQQNSVRTVRVGVVIPY